MLQPIASAWVFVLLVVTAAEAQPQPALGRSVTLTGSPGEPLPEVRVAANIPTVFLFDAPIERASVQLDDTRVELLDVGERSLIVSPRVSPAAQERWVLRARYSDRASPEWAAFALVAHPPEVDGRIDVVRRPQSLEACQSALAEARAQAKSPRAEVWGLAERLGGSSVQAKKIQGTSSGEGLNILAGTLYRFATGVLLLLTVENTAGQPSWAPTEGVLRREAGEQVSLRTVAMRPEQMEPGAQGLLAVEAELPSTKAEGNFTLEVRDASGRGFTLDGISIPRVQAPQKEDGR